LSDRKCLLPTDLARFHENDDHVVAVVADARALNERNLEVVLRFVADLAVGHTADHAAVFQVAANVQVSLIHGPFAWLRSGSQEAIFLFLDLWIRLWAKVMSLLPQCCSKRACYACRILNILF